MSVQINEEQLFFDNKSNNSKDDYYYLNLGKDSAIKKFIGRIKEENY